MLYSAFSSTSSFGAYLAVSRDNFNTHIQGWDAISNSLFYTWIPNRPVNDIAFDLSNGDLYTFIWASVNKHDLQGQKRCWFPQSNY